MEYKVVKVRDKLAIVLIPSKLKNFYTRYNVVEFENGEMLWCTDEEIKPVENEVEE